MSLKKKETRKRNAIEMRDAARKVGVLPVFLIKKYLRVAMRAYTRCGMFLNIKAENEKRKKKTRRHVNSDEGAVVSVLCIFC